MRALGSYGLAFILIAGLAAWLLTGLLVQGGKGPQDGEVTVVSAIEGDGGPITEAVAATGLAKEVEHAEGAPDAALSIAERNRAAATEAGPARSVRTRAFAVQPMPMDVTLRGHTAARASVNAVAKTSDTVLTVPVHEGQVVAVGDVICTLDDGTRQASVDQARAAVAQAEAALRQAQGDFNTNASLREKGLASANSAEGFAAALRAAEANFEAATVGWNNQNVELSNTEIRATVPGVIQRPLAKVGDMMNAGGTCATIVQLDPMIFVGAVPQAHIGLAKLGLPAEIRTINGETVQGEVSFIAVSADPATRSFEVEIAFPNPNGAIKDGLTAEAMVDLGTIPAHLLPQSIMTLDSAGTLGVKSVEAGKVVFHPITILKDSREGIWVTGLPARSDIIVLGQEYVQTGQTVDATSEE